MELQALGEIILWRYKVGLWSESQELSYLDQPIRLLYF